MKTNIFPSGGKKDNFGDKYFSQNSSTQVSLPIISDFNGFAANDFGETGKNQVNFQTRTQYYVMQQCIDRDEENDID